MEFVLNCLPSPRDTKDFLALQVTEVLPQTVDLEYSMSPVFNQLSLGSCTANAAVGFREFLELYRGESFKALSRNYVYWHERETEGTPGYDSGAYTKDAIGTLYTYGVCEESFFPYSETNYNDTPTPTAEANAPMYKISEYHRVLTSQQLMSALASGKPVLLGFVVFESFFTIDSTGIMPMPDLQVEVEQGGHCVLICGYKYINEKLYFKIRNSWGSEWADHGYFWMPVEYVDSRWVFDMWTGSLTTPYDSITYPQAIHILADGEHIYESPQFWLNLSTQFEQNPTSEYRFVELLLRKFAADSQNFAPLTEPLDYSTLQLKDALSYLSTKLVMASPDFWLNLDAAESGNPNSPYRFVAMAIIKYAARRMLLFP